MKPNSWLLAIAVIASSPCTAQECPSPAPSVSLSLLAPAADKPNQPVLGSKPLVIEVHSSVGAPEHVYFLINKAARGEAAQKEITTVNSEPGVYQVRTTIGEAHDAAIKTVPALNYLTVIAIAPGGKCGARTWPLYGVSAESRAVVIGIGSYQNLAPLTFPASDASYMKGKFEDLGVKPENVELLTDGTATYTAIAQALNRSKYMGKEATLYVYFSGHGFATDEDGFDPNAKGDPTKQRYLVPYSGVPTESTSLYSTDSFVGQIMSSSAGAKIFIFDSCFSGAAVDSAADAAWRAKGITADSGASDSGATGSGWGFNGQVLALLSASSGEPSYEVKRFSHGAFTYYLVSAGDVLKASQATVTIVDAFNYAVNQIETTLPGIVTDWDRHKQTPTIVLEGTNVQLRTWNK